MAADASNERDDMEYDSPNIIDDMDNSSIPATLSAIRSGGAAVKHLDDFPLVEEVTPDFPLLPVKEGEDFVDLPGRPFDSNTRYGLEKKHLSLPEQELCWHLWKITNREGVRISGC